jgi:hypothetical protein
MKKVLSLLAALLLGVVAGYSAPTGNVTLGWDANPTADAVTKYTLYQASGLTGTFVKVADITDGSNKFVVSGLAPGVYQFHITATNIWSEGPASPNVSTPNAVPSGPVRLEIKIIVIVP